jgi:Domain of unknown function (DUF4365)
LKANSRPTSNDGPVGNLRYRGRSLPTGRTGIRPGTSGIRASIPDTSPQLKAAQPLQSVGSAYAFDLDIRDYNLWMLERMPVILILFDASRRHAYWLAVQSYFRDDGARRPKQGAKTVRVRVPTRQAVTRRAVAKMRDLKWEARGRVIGVQS